MTKTVQPCPKCKGKRWRMLGKGQAWKCRKCGTVRAVAQGAGQ